MPGLVPGMIVFGNGLSAVARTKGRRARTAETRFIQA
jgi:hypothetical protein